MTSKCQSGYPAEFMAAVLTNGKGFYDPIVYVLESYRLGLTFLPPAINEPSPQFIAHGNTIRVPVIQAKGLSQRMIKRLVSERGLGAFTSLEDFHQRVRPTPEELEILFVRVGLTSLVTVGPSSSGA